MGVASPIKHSVGSAKRLLAYRSSQTDGLAASVYGIGEKYQYKCLLLIVALCQLCPNPNDLPALDGVQEARQWSYYLE